jgi:hypothetical protein
MRCPKGAGTPCAPGFLFGEDSVSGTGSAPPGAKRGLPRGIVLASGRPSEWHL